MKDKTKKVAPTKVTPTDVTPTIVFPIDWKRSFLSHPLVIIRAWEPFKYRIACRHMSDDGGTLTIVPALSTSIDDTLKIMEGCLQKESNFRTVLQEYYGDSAQKLSKIQFDFNGIEVAITEQMTAKEAKLKWLRDGLNAGYKNMVTHLTSEEIKVLESEEGMKELMDKYRREL